MSTVHNIRDYGNAADGQGWGSVKPWQKHNLRDLDGNLYHIGLENVEYLGTQRWSMHLWKYNDDDGSYSEVTEFASILTYGKGPSVSMQFDSARRRLCVVYTWNTAADLTTNVSYNEFDVIDGWWDISKYILLKQAMPTGNNQQVDLAISDDDRPHVVCYDGTSYYCKARNADGSWEFTPQMTCIHTPETGASGAVHIEYCEALGYFYLTMSEDADIAVLYMMVTGVLYPVSLGELSLQDPVMVCDEQGDVHLTGYAGNYLYYQKYDAASMELGEAEQAAGNIDHTCGYGICVRWDSENQRPEVYVFYAAGTQDIYYRKKTTAWGSVVSVDGSSTQVYWLNVERDPVLPGGDPDFMMCSFCDDDGATPYPEDAWHSGDILLGAFSGGGYYAKNRIYGTMVMGHDSRTGGWGRAKVYPAAIAGVIRGPGEVEATSETINNSLNKRVWFGDGFGMYEFDLGHDCLGVPLVSLAKWERADLGDGERWKFCEKGRVQFTGTGWKLLIANHEGAVYRADLDDFGSGKTIKINFGGRVFDVLIYQNSSEAGELREVDLRFYTNE